MYAWKIILLLILSVVVFVACTKSENVNTPAETVPSDTVYTTESVNETTDKADEVFLGFYDCDYIPDNLQLSVIHHDEHKLAGAFFPYDDIFPYYIVSFANGNSIYIESMRLINLLILNGGFVNCGNMFYSDGEMYVPVEDFCKAIGAEFSFRNYVCTVMYNDIIINYNFGRNALYISENSKNRVEKPKRKLKVNYGEVFLPVLYFGELFGYQAQLYQKEYQNDCLVNVAVVEDGKYDKYEKIYTPEEGREIIRNATKEMYEIIVDNIKRSKSLLYYSEQTLEKVIRDAESFEIEYSGATFGRYYIFNNSIFKEYNIYFNKFTGEIFSEMDFTSPFICVSPGLFYLIPAYQHD